MGSVCGSNKS